MSRLEVRARELYHWPNHVQELCLRRLEGEFMPCRADQFASSSKERKLMPKAWLSQLRAFYDRRVRDLEGYDDELATNAYKAAGYSPYWTRQIQQRLLDDIVGKLMLSPEHHVLDVGCGTGMILRHVAPHVAHIIGIDFSEQMIEIAKRHAPANATVQRENAVSLPFKDKMFDRVLCYSVILNFPDDDFTWSVLTELVRVTRNGGLVLVGNVPDYDKQEEQAEVVRKLQKNNTRPPQRCSFLRTISRLKDLWRYRIRRSVQPSQGNRFYTKDFFRRFAQQSSCDIEILPMNIEGFVYAPFRFDVRLRPLHR
jgi:ubiquinone/menaquinone biosynthesis C-methylase UbiE